MTFISIQLRATLLILLVVLIRSLFLYKLPKKVFLGLWAVVIARLLIPYSQNLPLGFALPSIENVWFFLLGKASGGLGAETMSSAATFTPFSIPGFLWWIWLAGCLGLAAYYIVSHMKGTRIYRFAYPVESDAVLKWAKENKIRRGVRILHCPELPSALTYGVFRPVILLPTTMDCNNTERLRFVLSHELIHIKHFDVLWKWGSTILLCFFWYNPMIWAMHILLGRDIELHCDECVLKKLGITKESKSKYAMALLALAEEKSRTLPLASHFSKSATEERILSIMHSRYAPALFIAIALLCVAILALLSFVTFMMEAGIAFTVPLT